MKKSEFLIGKPRVYPEKLMEGLIALFSKMPKIRSAYLAQIFVPTSGIPAHPVICIDMDGKIQDIA